MDLLLRLLVTLLLSWSAVVESRNSFLLTAPKTLRPGRDFTLQWRLLTTPTQPVTVETSITSADTVVIATTSTSSSEGADVTVALPVPSDLDSSLKYSLSVKVTGGINYSHKQGLSLKQKSISVYIQTDKAVYKPGQTVNFRVFAVTPELKIVYDKVKVEIFDPKGNKINQWDVSGSEITSLGGVYVQRQVMSEFPEMGEWRIKAKYLSYKQETEVQAFRVEEYVLPKFEVELDLPSFGRTTDSTFEGKVKAKYTFGKPVKGETHLVVKPKRERWSFKNNTRIDMRKSIELNFPINGEAKFTLTTTQLKEIESLLNGNVIMFEVNVTETLTRAKQGDTQEVSFYDKPIKVEFPKALPDTFKPGMTYDCVVKVALRDDTPPGTTDSDLDVTITEYRMTSPRAKRRRRQERFMARRRPPMIMPPWPPVEPWFPSEVSKTLPLKRYPIPPSGIVEFPVEVNSALTKIRIEASYDGDQQSKVIKKRHSPSDSFIQVTTDQHMAQAGQPMQLKVKTTDTPASVSYMIYAKGRLTDSGVIKTTGKTTTWSPMATATMMPRARIIVYYVREDGEIVADVLTINVDGTFENKVSINFNRTTAAPADSITLDIRADGGSKVNVLAVDKSVLLMGSGNDISQSKVTSELRTFDDDNSRSKDSQPWPICDWFCWRWPMPSSGEDVKDVFEDAGLLVFTDALLYEYIEPKRRPIALPGRHFPMFDFGGVRRNFRQMDAMRAPMMAMAGAMPAFNERSGAMDMMPPPIQPTKPEELAPVGRTRTLFPETFLWKSADMPASGVLTSQEVVPDTITSWVATAFAVHPVTGLGLSESAANLEVSMPFFVSVNMPYSVVRGEKVILQVNIHNFSPNPLFTYVVLSMSSDFENIHITASDQTTSSADVTRTVTIASNEIVAVYFPIIPRTIGRIDINLRAQTSTFTDAVTRKLLVEAEGSEREYNLPFVVDLKEQGSVTNVADVTFPVRTVSGSERVTVTVIGDLMGPSINGLDKLLKMPYGCGEQNMLNFAPNIFILKYLESTNSLDDGIMTKAKEFMEKGYQRELTYMHPDGSFSAFGDRDPSGSTWLTAFVLKSFVQAKPYIFIDEAVIHKSVDWLVKQQNENGTFNEPGRVIHKAMQGGSTSGHISLTAYILISLVEAQVVQGVETKTTAAKTKAIRYLEDHLTGLTDLYDLAIVYYSLTLVGSSRAPEVWAKLDAKAISQGGSLHWEKEIISVTNKPWERRNGMAVNIELTSYVLLGLAQLSDRVKGVQVLKWLTEQRNPEGGFSSTQDTVLALQALAEMASLIFSPSYDLRVDVTGNDARGNAVLQSFSINQQNALVLQTRELPSDIGTVTITSTGKGLALVQIAAAYNIDDDDQKKSFQLTVNIPRETQHDFDVAVCTRWMDEGSSSMAVLEIGAPSGFVPDPQSLTSTPEHKRMEIANRKLVLYFDEIASRDTCVTVTMHKVNMVAGAQPVPVHVYDYYEPSKQVTEFYVPETLRRSDVCDVCGTECDVCVKR